MAKLHRMVKLDDRFNTHVFTFLLPSSAVSGQSSMDTFSREFVYGHQKWTFSAVRGDTHLGASVSLSSVCEFMTVTVDVTFTMVNQEHYTKSERFEIRGCGFNSQCVTHGRRNFIGLSDLVSRNFQTKHESGWYVMELEMRDPKSNFEQIIDQLAKDQTGRFPRYETSYFSFGNFDWTLFLYPNGDCPQTEGRALACLVRQTSFDNICRIVYQVSIELLGGPHMLFESTGSVVSLVNTSGQCSSYELQCVSHLDGPDPRSERRSSVSGGKGQLKVKLNLISCTAIGEVQLCPFSASRKRAYLYDRDKQAWMIESDVSGDILILRLFYGDIRHVPRGHLRYVSWCVRVIPVNQLQELSSASGPPPDGSTSRQKTLPHSNFYVQTDIDEGYSINTNISIAELNNSGVYLDSNDGGKMTIHVEWLDSQLLFQDKWQHTDNVIAQHRHQMRRELHTLEAENLALEKQIHSYQISIARNNAKWTPGGTPNDSTVEDNINGKPMIEY